jgi:hypothetical protein
MNQYVGLDVSLEETKIHVLDEAGGRVCAVSVRAIPTNSTRPYASMRRVRFGSASRPGR